MEVGGVVAVFTSVAIKDIFLKQYPYLGLVLYYDKYQKIHPNACNYDFWTLWIQVMALQNETKWVTPLNFRDRFSNEK